MYGNIILKDDSILIIIPKDDYPKNMKEWRPTGQEKKVSLYDREQSNACTRLRSGKLPLPS